MLEYQNSIYGSILVLLLTLGVSGALCSMGSNLAELPGVASEELHLFRESFEGLF